MLFSWHCLIAFSAAAAAVTYGQYWFPPPTIFSAPGRS